MELQHDEVVVAVAVVAETVEIVETAETVETAAAAGADSYPSSELASYYLVQLEASSWALPRAWRQTQVHVQAQAIRAVDEKQQGSQLELAADSERALLQPSSSDQLQPWPPLDALEDWLDHRMQPRLPPWRLRACTVGRLRKQLPEMINVSASGPRVAQRLMPTARATKPRTTMMAGKTYREPELPTP